MRVIVALGTWPRGLKLYRDTLLKKDDHHFKVILKMVKKTNC